MIVTSFAGNTFAVNHAIKIIVDGLQYFVQVLTSLIGVQKGRYTLWQRAAGQMNLHAITRCKRDQIVDGIHDSLASFSIYRYPCLIVILYFRLRLCDLFLYLSLGLLLPLLFD